MITILSLMLACTDPHDVMLSPKPDAWANDEKLKDAVQKLTPEEQGQLKEYMMRKVMSPMVGGEGIPPMGVSLRDALTEEQAWIAEQAVKKAAAEKAEAEAAALAAKVKAEQDAKRKVMDDAVTVAVTKLKFRPSNIYAGVYQDSISISVAFENKSDKKMIGVKGHVVFSDMFGELIANVGVAYDKPIEAKAAAVWNASLEYNQFKDTDVKLAFTELSAMKVVWVPETVIFADGTSLTVAEE